MASSEIDKFVLQYNVELSDSIARLEKLSKKTESVGKESNNAKKGLKGLSDELSAMRAGVSEASSGLSGLVNVAARGAPALAALGAAVGGVALALKAVSFAQKNLIAQNNLGIKLGTGATSIAAIESAMARASGGRISREQTRSTLGKINDTLTGAWLDPYRNNEQARKLRAAGINPVGENGQMISTQEALLQFSKQAASVDLARARALGALIDLDQNEVDALRKMNGQMSEFVGMTDDQAKAHLKAAEASRELEKESQRLKTAVDNAAQSIGDKLLPKFADMMKGFADVAETVGKMVQNPSGAFSGSLDVWGGTGKGLIAAAKVLAKGGSQDEALKALQEEFAKGHAAANAKVNGKPVTPATQAQINAQGELNKGAAENLRTETMLINQFGAAVQAFSGAVSKQDAIAAWAGELGRAAGFGKGNSTSAPVKVNIDRAAEFARLNSNVPAFAGSTPYDAHFEAAAKATGVPVDLLKRVAHVESRMNPKIVSEAGAQGVMQLMPEISKALNVANPFDPAQNIMGGARLLAENLTRAGGDWQTALMMYHGGLDRKNWGAKTNAYPGLVMGPNWAPSVANAWSGKYTPTYTISGGTDIKGGGASRERLQRMALIQAIAGVTGVSAEQIMAGQITRGDMDFGLDEVIKRSGNAYSDAKTMLGNAGNLTPAQRAALLTGMRDSGNTLMSAMRFGSSLQDNVAPGGRNATLGVMPTQMSATFNITGGDPKAIADEVEKRLAESYSTLSGNGARGVKY